MFTKIWIAVGIALAIISTTFFVVKQNALMAATSIVGMFILTNLLRSIAFKERNMDYEAAWMKRLTYMSMALFIVLVIGAIVKR